MSEAKNDESELTALLGERYARALLLRRDGLTYKAVGQELGVSASRARMMVLRAERKLANPRPHGDFSDLTERAKNCLRGAGYETKAQVLEAVNNGLIHPSTTGLNDIPNYGKKSHREVCEWLGLDTDPKPNEKTIERYIAYLERHGYKVNKLT